MNEQFSVSIDALILRVRNNRNADLDLTLFDKKLGRINAIAFGAASSKSSKGKTIDTGNRITGECRRNSPEMKYLLTESRLEWKIISSRNSLNHMKYLFLFLEFLSIIIPEQIETDYYEAVLSLMKRIDQSDRPEIPVLFGIFKIMQREGLFPGIQNQTDLNHFYQEYCFSKDEVPGKSLIRLLLKFQAEKTPAKLKHEEINPHDLSILLNFYRKSIKEVYHQNLNSLLWID